MGNLSKTIYVHIRGKGHTAAVNSEYGSAAFGIGNGDDDLTVKTAWSSEGGIDQFGNIGCTDHHDIATGNHAIHQSEELCHYSFFDILILLSGR